MVQEYVITSTGADDTQLLKAALEIAGIGTWRLDPRSRIVIWDERCKELYGFNKNDEVPYEEVLRYVHPEDVASVDQAVQAAVRGENEGRYEIRFRTIGAADQKLRWLLCRGQAYFDALGTPVLFAGTAQDITDLISAEHRISSSEQLARYSLEASDAGFFFYDYETGLLDTSERLRILLTGSADGAFTREDLTKFIHPEDVHIREEAYREAVRTGQISYMIRFVHPDGAIRWIRLTGSMDIGPNGQPRTMSGIMQDVTEKQQHDLSVRQNEQFLRTILQNSPTAKMILLGEELTVRIVNGNGMELLCADESILNQPLITALPQLRDTDLHRQLLEVFHTGTVITGFEEKFPICAPGADTCFYNYIFVPLRNNAGEIYGVIATYMDCSLQVMERNKANAAQAILNAALETAALATWEVNPHTGEVTVSERLRDWMGFGADETLSRGLAASVLPEPGEITEAIVDVLAAGADGVVDQECQIKNRNTGELRYVRLRGQYYEDPQHGRLVVGTCQDITAQRRMRMLLEQTVQERTENLAEMNKELSQANAVLGQMNAELNRSNEELARFAYVASHDLQEPLRKIRMFSSMLNRRLAEDTQGAELVEKISGSAARMSSLINGLLDISRLEREEVSGKGPVVLNEVMTDLLTDYELLIREKNISIQVGPLPTVEGSRLQLTQLFYNLLSNAFKFELSGRPVHVSIHAESINNTEAATHVESVLPGRQYVRITVADNGVGFEMAYHDQIFEIFKRLHSRDDYQGSGIGLALCRRIAINHHGALFAQSAVGEGSSFHVLLPVYEEAV